MLREERLFEPLLIKALVASGIIHVALFLWAAFGGRLYFGSDDVRIIPVTLISGQIGTGFPEVGSGAAQQSEKSESEKAQEAQELQPDRMKAPDTSTKKATDADKKLRSAIERIRKQANKEEAAEGSDSGGTSGVVGPYGQGGLSGTIASFYLGEIWDSIRRNWSMPKAGVDIPKDARVSFLVKVDASGNAISISMLKSSGYDLLDNSALVAIKKAAPFSPPPSMLVDTLLREGMEVRFFAQEIQR